MWDKSLTSHGFPYYLRISDIYEHLDNVRTTRKSFTALEMSPSPVLYVGSFTYNFYWTSCLVNLGLLEQEEGLEIRESRTVMSQTAFRILILKTRNKLMRSIMSLIISMSSNASQLTQSEAQHIYTDQEDLTSPLGIH